MMPFRAKAAAVLLALIAAVVVFVVFIGIKTWRERDRQVPALASAPVTAVPSSSR